MSIVIPTFKKIDTKRKEYGIKLLIKMATIRAEIAAKEIAENNRSVSAAMKIAGYSPSTATRPATLTKTKGFQELMDKYLPERHLMKKHAEFLNTPRRIRSYKKGDLVEETEETDPSAVKALDMAYKLKGKYATTASNNVLVINVSGQASERYGTVQSKAIEAEPRPQDATPQPEVKQSDEKV